MSKRGRIVRWLTPEEDEMLMEYRHRQWMLGQTEKPDTRPKCPCGRPATKDELCGICWRQEHGNRCTFVDGQWHCRNIIRADESLCHSHKNEVTE